MTIAGKSTNKELQLKRVIWNWIWGSCHDHPESHWNQHIIRRITFWLALLQIPRLLFKLMKAIGTTCIGMDRHCNWKGRFDIGFGEFDTITQNHLSNQHICRVTLIGPASNSATRFSRTISYVPKKSIWRWIWRTEWSSRIVFFDATYCYKKVFHVLGRLNSDRPAGALSLRQLMLRQWMGARFKFDGYWKISWSPCHDFGGEIRRFQMKPADLNEFYQGDEIFSWSWHQILRGGGSDGFSKTFSKRLRSDDFNWNQLISGSEICDPMIRRKEEQNKILANLLQMIWATGIPQDQTVSNETSWSQPPGVTQINFKKNMLHQKTRSCLIIQVFRSNLKWNCLARIR